MTLLDENRNKPDTPEEGLLANETLEKSQICRIHGKVDSGKITGKQLGKYQIQDQLN